MPDPPARIDHLVHACANLDAGVDHITRLLGVRPVPGGSHPHWGTHNALLGLGPSCYLEVIAPLPSHQTGEVQTPEVFSGSGDGRLTTWAARVGNLQGRAPVHGTVDPPLGDLKSGSRRRSDGSTLSWVLTDPMIRVLDGMVPFLIDWGDSEHPAQGLESSCSLECLRAAHPRHQQLRSSLRTLGLLDLVEVRPSIRPTLTAVIRTPGGQVEI